VVFVVQNNVLVVGFTLLFTSTLCCLGQKSIVNNYRWMDLLYRYSVAAGKEPLKSVEQLS